MHMMLRHAAGHGRAAGRSWCCRSGHQGDACHGRAVQVSHGVPDHGVSHNHLSPSKQDLPRVHLLLSQSPPLSNRTVTASPSPSSSIQPFTHPAGTSTLRCLPSWWPQSTAQMRDARGTAGAYANADRPRSLAWPAALRKVAEAEEERAEGRAEIRAG
jgi:hypothetical protein